MAQINESQPGEYVPPPLPTLIRLLLSDQFTFRPAPPLPEPRAKALDLGSEVVQVEASRAAMEQAAELVRSGCLEHGELVASLKIAGLPPDFRGWAEFPRPTDTLTWSGQVAENHRLDSLALLAVQVVDDLQKKLLELEPLKELQFRLSNDAKALLVTGWAAMTKRGSFPLPPQGSTRMNRLRGSDPYGTMHFVSASDLDAGYYFTLGIALSPEAQALGTMDVTFGLDGELIVPGQAVSPIPPYLAMATRLFAASIPTSSNISEEEQSIPVRDFPRPNAADELQPRRGGRPAPVTRPRDLDATLTELRRQLAAHGRRSAASQSAGGITSTIGASFDVTGLNRHAAVRALRGALGEPDIRERKDLIALFVNLEPVATDRVGAIIEAIEAAKELGLKHVAVADDAEDAWLANLLEYLEPEELNAVAEYADQRGIVVVDGRPVDAVYTAATAAQRIQSVYTTLAVDVLKMGMWLCLDALTARHLWREIHKHPHIPRRMLLMPIGIVEPWNGFVDNRSSGKTARAILDPFEKIKFMIEEACMLGMPSLLTDTRHKQKWVLLGRRRPSDEPHPRERFVRDPASGEILGRTEDSAVPLLNWDEFMECERLARRASIFLGQAGSVEIDQLFRIISDTTYDAACDCKNPATAIWTAETERVLKTSTTSAADLQRQRSGQVSPFLAVINRGQESHAKLDGWLRYLASINDGDASLRSRLTDLREGVLRALEELIKAQDQASWDLFREAYLQYHGLVRASYPTIRAKVSEAWHAGRTCNPKFS